MAKIFTRETPAKDILSRIESISACSEAVAWHKRYVGKTFGELADNMSDPAYKPAWAAWALRYMGRASEATIIRTCINKITDPMMAFQLYLDLDWLSDDEDELLEAKFKGKLPTAEAELAQGIVKRKKS